MDTGLLLQLPLALTQGVLDFLMPYHQHKGASRPQHNDAQRGLMPLRRNQIKPIRHPRHLDCPLMAFHSVFHFRACSHFQWLRHVPDRLRHRVTPILTPGEFAAGPILVLLYAGKDDPLSLDRCLHAHYPRLSSYILAFDTKRPPQKWGQDLWSTL